MDAGAEPAAKKPRPDPAAAAAELDAADELDAAAEAVALERKKKVVRSGRECPFIDTVDRRTLDFDFEKLCSVTLVNLNCYCCLICGKYFQGRARGSPAYTHSLENGHSVYMNLTNRKIYCLPDDYEVVDPSLDDIKANMRPAFTPEQIKELDHRTRTSLALDGSEYLPGFVGFNNLKLTDGISVVVQCLMRVVPFRDYLLRPENYAHCRSLLLGRLGELARKNWNPSNYKSHISPHELVQACSIASEKRFRPGARSDPADFMAWVLNTLQRDMNKANKKLSKRLAAESKASAAGGGKKAGRPKQRNIVNECFRGEVHVMTEKLSDKKAAVSAAADNAGLEESSANFLFLSLDLPQAPLYKDAQNHLVIPQVSLFSLLEKFDGETSQELRGGLLRRFRLKHPLPRYLIFHYKRFKLNNFFVEKNPTLVTFPVKNLELKDYIDGTPPPSDTTNRIGTKFNLVANVVHSGPADGGKYGTCTPRARSSSSDTCRLLSWFLYSASVASFPVYSLAQRRLGVFTQSATYSTVRTMNGTQ